MVKLAKKLLNLTSVSVLSYHSFLWFPGIITCLVFSTFPNRPNIFYKYCGNCFKRNWCCVGGELKHNKLG